MKKLIIAGLAILLAACSANPQLDMPRVEDQIEVWYGSLGLTNPTVTVYCGEDRPAIAGYRFICTLQEPDGTWNAVIVSVLNAEGDITWLPTP